MKSVVLMGMAAILFPAEAFAQMHPQSPWPVERLPDESEFERDNYAREVMDRYGKCIAKKDKDYARKFALGEISEFEITRDNKFLSPYCLSARDAKVMRIYAAGLLGPVAEYLIEKDFGGPVPMDVSGVTLSTPKQSDVRIIEIEVSEGEESEMPKISPDALRNAIPYRTRGTTLADIGECMVREHQPEVLLLLNSGVGRAGEKEAVGKIKAVLGDCAVEGRSLSIDTTALRTAMAVGYYRLASAKHSVQATE